MRSRTTMCTKHGDRTVEMDDQEVPSENARLYEKYDQWAEKTLRRTYDEFRYETMISYDLSLCYRKLTCSYSGSETTKLIAPQCTGSYAFTALLDDNNQDTTPLPQSLFHDIRYCS